MVWAVGLDKCWERMKEQQLSKDERRELRRSGEGEEILTCKRIGGGRMEGRGRGGLDLREALIRAIEAS